MVKDWSTKLHRKLFCVLRLAWGRAGSELFRSLTSSNLFLSPGGQKASQSTLCTICPCTAPPFKPPFALEGGEELAEALQSNVHPTPAFLCLQPTPRVNCPPKRSPRGNAACLEVVACADQGDSRQLIQLERRRRSTPQAHPPYVVHQPVSREKLRQKLLRKC